MQTPKNTYMWHFGIKERRASCRTLAFIVINFPDVGIRIELVQESDTYEDGRLLAWYESSARDFLYPYPSYSLSYGTHDRELLLERTLAFPVRSSKPFP